MFVPFVSTCSTVMLDCCKWFSRFMLFFGCTLLLIVLKYFLFSVVVGRSEVV